MAGAATTSTSRVWFTWETQRRNKEMAQAFNAAYQKLDYSESSRLVRYVQSIFGTISILRWTRPKTVFAQCPSLVLAVLLAAIKPFFAYTLVLDTHNIIVDKEYLSNPLVRFLVTFAFKKSAFVIVSNEGLFHSVETLGGNPVVLPDKIPTLSDSSLPERFASMSSPITVLIASYASDEPIGLVLEAFKSSNSPGTLFVTGKKSRAGKLLRFSSDRVVFTDFLEYQEFDGLIREADLVIDVTVLDNCLVCGAYEALAAGVPMLLSDNQASRSWFNSGCLFADNDINAYQKAMSEFFGNIEHFREGIKELQLTFPARWNEAFEAIEQRLAEV